MSLFNYSITVNMFLSHVRLQAIYDMFVMLPSYLDIFTRMRIFVGSGLWSQAHAVPSRKHAYIILTPLNPTYL